VAILPALEDGREAAAQAVRDVGTAYGLRIEIQSFSTAADQQKLLHLLPQTDVDGVLLWPVSTDDRDYSGALRACSQADLPVVVIDRDVAAGSRSSFIGSGIASGMLVLEQSLATLPEDDFLTVGNSFSSGSAQAVELVVFSRSDSAGVFQSDQIRDPKLRRVAQKPPTGWHAQRYVCLEGEDARALQLRYNLESLLRAYSPGLFFSLDRTLTEAAASAKSELGRPESAAVQLLGYGDAGEDRDLLEDSTLDGLLTSKPAISAKIAVRYLRDLCRGFWVPSTMDSGITFLPSESYERAEEAAESRQP
jgi:hypothetical protein